MSALQSHQRALDIRVKLFGEEHPDTAQSYVYLGITQNRKNTHTQLRVTFNSESHSQTQSPQRALDMRVTVFGEEHADTAQSYGHFRLTQHALGDYVRTLVLSAWSGH